MSFCRSLWIALCAFATLLASVAVHAQASPYDAMRTCKNEAGERMRRVPLALIEVERGTDPGNGGYMVNFRAQPRNGPAASGFCEITWNGHVQNFEFDAPPPPASSPPPYGGRLGAATENFGGPTQFEAMRSCKSSVSTRFPDVPLAFIVVDTPRVNGGSLLALEDACVLVTIVLGK